MDGVDLSAHRGDGLTGIVDADGLGPAAAAILVGQSHLQTGDVVRGVARDGERHRQRPTDLGDLETDHVVASRTTGVRSERSGSTAGRPWRRAVASSSAAASASAIFEVLSAMPTKRAAGFTRRA